MERPIVWLCGRPGAGKTTLALAVSSKLRELQILSDVLDSDFYRKHLLMPQDFTERSNLENAKRYGRLGGLLAKNGVIPIIAAVAWTPEIVAAFKMEFPYSLLVYLHCPLHICALRDPQGLYLRTGDEVERIYRQPESYDLMVDTSMIDEHKSAAVILERILHLHRSRGPA